MPTRTTPPAVSSSRTWDGCSLRSTPTSSRQEGSLTSPTLSRTPWSCSRRSSIPGSLFTCATSCPRRSPPTSGARIFGPPSSLPVPSAMPSFFTSRGWSTRPLILWATTPTTSLATPPKIPSFRSAPSARDGTTGITSTPLITPPQSLASPRNSTPPNFSLICVLPLALYGAASAVLPHGRWVGHAEIETVLPASPSPRHPQDRGRLITARRLSKRRKVLGNSLLF
mmetsp:Transcript_33936/g.73548  ORF Transcript_33936/g.73548 Transcript_33936/m.73548 type:complete len:226 (-) Transcript_33936:135-812(-)